jgi:ubiquinone/menaquinone biosynthesis C-methylase UbiE
MKDQIDLSKMESIPTLNPNGFFRLHRYWREPSNEMWDEIWSKTDELSYWEDSLKGELLKEYENVFLKYMSPNDRVLEAGSGIGQVVLALRARGFDCYGLDYAEKIISILNSKFPHVPFHLGDIRNLPYDPDFFDSYISLGVIEHFTEGQQQMLTEACRVIKPSGHIFLSVPYLNPYRKLLVKLNLYKPKSYVPKLPYFETCFSKEELKFLFESTGFTILDYAYINPIMPFVQESWLRPFYRFIEDKRFLRSLVDKILNLILPKLYFGHMIMVIAKKKV